MKRLLVLVLAALMIRLGHVAQWLIEWIMEGEVMANGPKEQAALDALDETIAALRAWKDAEDETDASQILERKTALDNVFRPTPGQPVDALTGQPVPVDGGTTPSTPEEPTASN